MSPLLAVTPDILDRGRALLDAAYGHVPSAAVEYGPPQPPLDELHGLTFSRDMVGDLSPDEFGRDDFSVDQRVRAWEYLNAAYELNRHRPVAPPIWQPPGLYILSGEQGGGKTMTAGDLGVIFLMCGWPAYSVNGGLCFGKTLEKHQVYSFADYMTRGGFGFGDEIHAIYGRYEGQTVRGRTMAQGTAGFRKEKIWFTGATSREWMIGADLKAAVRGVGYPFQWNPSAPTAYPPLWAHRGVEWYFPDPWRGNEFREQFDKTRQHRQPCRRSMVYHDPHSLYRAAQHYVSWEKIELDFGGALGADEFRDRMESDQGAEPDPYQVGSMILGWYEDGAFAAAEEAYVSAKAAGRRLDRGPHILRIEDIAALYEKEVRRTISVAAIGRALRAVEAEPSSRDRIPVMELARAKEHAMGQTAAVMYG